MQLEPELSWTLSGAVDEKGHINFDTIADNIIKQDRDPTFVTILTETERLLNDAVNNPAGLEAEAEQYRRHPRLDQALGHSSIRIAAAVSTQPSVITAT